MAAKRSNALSAFLTDIWTGCLQSNSWFQGAYQCAPRIQSWLPFDRTKQSAAYCLPISFIFSLDSVTWRDVIGTKAYNGINCLSRHVCGPFFVLWHSAHAMIHYLSQFCLDFQPTAHNIHTSILSLHSTMEYFFHFPWNTAIFFLNFQ